MYDGMLEARRAYMKLLKNTEELNQEQTALAAESFVEGWIQCERCIKEHSDAQPKRTA